MEQKNNAGMLGMIFGIVGIVLSLLGMFTPISIFGPIIGLILGILGIIFGVKGRKAGVNTGMGTAGLVTGIIAVVFGGITALCVGCAVCAAATIVGGSTELMNELSSLM